MMLYQLKWSFRKVLSRGPFYLPRRIGYTLKKKYEDRRFYRFLGKKPEYFFAKSISTEPEALRWHFMTRQSPRFHFRAEDIPLVADAIPEEEKRATVEKAKAVLENRYVLKGREIVIEKPMNWETDPADASGWQCTLNRQFFYSDLGFAYWHTRDERFVDKFVELSSSWIQKNIPSLGKIAWDTPFEVAARINAWIWAYFLFHSCERWPPEKQREFLAAIAILAEYLYRTIEFHNPGNHIMLEAKALALCAGLFPEFKNSRRWGKKAWRILRKELRKQINPDGVHAELSSMYHAIVTGELAELAIFCRRNNVPVPGLNERVESMSDFLVHISEGLSTLPLWGDSYEVDTYIRFWGPAIIDSIKNPENPIYFSAPFSMEQTLWSIGDPAPHRTWEIAKENRFVDSAGYKQSGYFVSRWGKSFKTVLQWDCGNIGYHANPYHSHIDLLSFVLAIDGKWIFIDPGYDERKAEDNQYLRDSPAHNTLLADGQSQAILAPRKGRFEIWKAPRPRLDLWYSSKSLDLMSGAHDGFCRLKNPLVHRRMILSVKNGYWLIRDLIYGQGIHRVQLRFHVAPGLEVSIDSANTLRIKDKMGMPAIVMKGNLMGGASVEAFMIEKSFAELRPNNFEETVIVRRAVFGHGTMEIVTLLSPGKGDSYDLKYSNGLGEKHPHYSEIAVLAENCQDKFIFRRGFAANSRNKKILEYIEDIKITRTQDGIESVLYP